MVSQIICGNCGAANAAGDQFCGNCGYALAGGPIGLTSHAPTLVSPGRPHITGTLLSGNLLSSRYRILRLVGKGGFGAVYQARDERFSAQRMLAIKEMSDRQLTPKERLQALRDFRHEADLLVQLRHPNLPDVSDFFEEGGKAYLVMEFIEGDTLEKKQDNVGGPLDELLVIGWALQLCNVLEYLHTQSPPIIFRDMKPSNVMVTKQGQIKLIDFGIARAFKSASAKDTTSLGSGGYAPLEQYGSHQTDARSDIYALGATLYNLLTNKVPADAPARAVNPSVFVTPRTLNPRISVAIEQIILKAMAREAKDRYQSAAEMAQAIVSIGSVPAPNIGLHAAPTLPNTIAAQPAGAPTIAATLLSSPQPGAAMIPAPGGPGQRQQQQQIMAPPPQKPQGFSRRAVIGLAAAGAVAAAFGVYFFSRSGSTSSNPANAVTVNFTYSTEKKDWIEAVTEAFHSQGKSYNNKPIQVVLDELGSVEAKTSIEKGEIKPVAWSPASSLELNQLNAEWQQQHNGSNIVNLEDSPSLVSTPLVFATWKQRADVLLQHYQGTIDWPQLHDALTKNSWSDIGGSSHWGPVKFGHTRPVESNSGLLTILLIAYAFYQKSRGLTAADLDNPKFQQYFQDFEGAVNLFGHSTGSFFNVVLQDGPPQYDVIATYESVVLTNEQTAISRQQQELLMLYPSVNILSNNPFAILSGNGTTQEQQIGARMFRNFLLAKEQQQKALASGFRPTNPAVKITDNVPKNAFRGQPAAIHISPRISSLARVPEGLLIDKLLNMWNSLDGTAQSASGS